MAKKTVLLVDDSLVAHQVLQEMLEGGGYAVVGNAYDGDQAVKLYLELRPDVVLLDIIMPQKDGLATLKEILQHDANAAVIMATSFGTADAVEQALDSGAKGFVQKPYDRDNLMQQLAKTIG